MRNNVSNLMVAFLNVRSLRHKISEVCDFIYDNSVDVIGLAETWLDDTVADGYVHIPDFTLFRRDCIGQTGGGVCFYCKSCLAACRRHDLEEPRLESLVVDIKSHKGNPSLTVSLYYIPPFSPSNCLGYP